MTAYVLTPALHAQLVDALNSSDYDQQMVVRDMLKAMKPVEPAAYMNPDESYSIVTVHQKETNEFQYSKDFLKGHTVPLYTIGETE